MKNDISYLNDILEILYNSCQCYKDHTENVKNPKLKNLFSNIASQREKFIDEIKAMIQQLGTKPSDKASVLGTLPEVFENIKSALTHGDPIAIGKEIRRGENLLIENYQQAIKETGLSDEMKAQLTIHMKQIDENLRDMDALIIAG